MVRVAFGSRRLHFVSLAADFAEFKPLVLPVKVSRRRLEQFKWSRACFPKADNQVAEVGIIEPVSNFK